MTERYALDRISDERTARIALSYAVPVGHYLTGRLVYQYGGLQTLQAALGNELPGVDPTMLGAWRSYFEGYDSELVARGVDLAEQHGLMLLIPGDAGWPTGIDDLGGVAPVALWARGNRPELLSRPLWERATIVGARAASFNGQWDAQQLSVGLALNGVPVVAGAWHGVSRMALAGTLGNEVGAVAVFSSGLDNLYPRTPNGFFDSIADGGILISETPPGVAPSRDSLQGISRIVAALSAVTTLVESGPRGQAMGAAFYAKELHRLVAAIRGPEDATGSIGPNMLLDRGAAQGVTNHQGILTALNSFHRKSDFIETVNEPLRQAQTATPEELQRSHNAPAPERGASRSL